MRIQVETHLVTIVKDGTARIYLADAQGNISQMAQVTVPLDIRPERAAVLTLSIANVMDDTQLDMRVETGTSKALQKYVPPNKRSHGIASGKPGRVPGQKDKKDLALEFLQAAGAAGATSYDIAEYAGCTPAYVGMALKPQAFAGLIRFEQVNMTAPRTWYWVGEQGKAEEAEPLQPSAAELGVPEHYLTGEPAPMANTGSLAEWTEQEARAYLTGKQPHLIEVPGISTPELTGVRGYGLRAIELVRQRGAMNTSDLRSELGLTASYLRRVLHETPELVSHQNKESLTAPLIWTLRETEAASNGTRRVSDY